MARGINKVIIVGTMGQDPTTRYTQSGTAITEISLATNEAWTDKASGEKQERTEWHRVKFFGKLAEIAGEYLAKGRQVYVEGKLRTDKWTDDAGVERYTTNIIADEMQMLGGAPSEGGGQKRDGGYGGPDQRRGSQRPAGHGTTDGGRGYGHGGGGGEGSARERAQRASQGTAAMNQQRSAPPTNEGFNDDDIPF